MRTLVLDSQILETFQECGQKYNLNFRENLRSANVVDAIVKGDVLHTVFEGYYTHLKEGLEGDTSRDILHVQGIERGIEDGRAKAALNGIDLYDSEEVIKATEEYFSFYKDDDIVPLYIEQPFIKLLYEDPDQDLRVLYAGKIDLVATAHRYEWKPIPFDHKSTSRNTAPSGRHNQFFGYTMAVDSNLLVVNRVGFQKTLSYAERFKRLNLSYPDEYKENWIKNTIKWAFKLAWAIENNQYEENLSSCDKFSGCTYKPYCEATTEEAKEWVVQSRFIIGEPWDVSKILSLKENNEQIIIPKAASQGSVEMFDSDVANKRV